MMVDLTIHEPTSSQGNSKPAKSFELPIALRKLTGLCILHPLSRFVSYNILSHRFHAFMTNLDRAEIPKNIHEALKNSKMESNFYG